MPDVFQLSCISNKSVYLVFKTKEIFLLNSEEVLTKSASCLKILVHLATYQKIDLAC